MFATLCIGAASLVRCTAIMWATDVRICGQLLLKHSALIKGRCEVLVCRRPREAPGRTAVETCTAHRCIVPSLFGVRSSLDFSYCDTARERDSSETSSRAFTNRGILKYGRMTRFHRVVWQHKSVPQGRTAAFSRFHRVVCFV